MINFKKIMETIHEKDGYCHLHDRHYAAVDGVRIDCTTKERALVKVHWVIDWCEPHRPILRFLNGVTGHESYYVEHLKRHWNNDKRFCACAGTPRHWDELWLDADQIKTIIDGVK